MSLPVPVTFHHVGITVSNLERAVEWYSKVFGLKPGVALEVSGPSGERVLRLPPHIHRAALLPVGDFAMHLEFRLPFKPSRLPSSQDRGNSGIYIYDNYECQVLDSFALDFVEANNPFKTQSRNKQWCGSFYKFKLPDVPMAFPPLRWQTYDIDFTAPVFDGDKKVKNARMTIRLNGIVIHDNIEINGKTGGSRKDPEGTPGPIKLQGHNNPLQFRNVWIVEK